MAAALSISSGSLNLGTVTSERVNIEVPLLYFSLPLTGSTGVTAFDILGKKLFISITGSITGSSLSNAKTIKDQIQNWIDTASSVTANTGTYSSDTLTAVTVVALGFEYQFGPNLTGPQTIDYTLHLLKV